MKDNQPQPIGVFDSGYGGLTILKELVKKLPSYDFIYLGDNARAPYGPRSFETVYAYALEAVIKLFSMGCRLVIIACNTASAKALRSIQQKNLPLIDPAKRVLGVIRPTVEYIGRVTVTGHIGVLGTTGTVASNSYPLEIAKLYPGFTVVQEACPLWVPLVESNELSGPGTEYFVRKHIERLLSADPAIDAVILGCTHYPLLLDTIMTFTPAGVKVIPQDSIVAESLADYLRRHPEIDAFCSRRGLVRFFTTDSADLFSTVGSIFYGSDIRAEKISLP